MKLKKIKNITKHAVVLPMTIDGKRTVYELTAGQEDAFPEEVANKFLEMRPEFIKDVSLYELTTSEAAFMAQQAIQEIVWLANVTGNPSEDDCPSDLKVQRYNKKTEEHFEVLIKNPLKEPATWRETMPGSWVEYTGKGGGKLAAVGKPIVVEIRPFERRPFPKHIANWVLRRSMNNLKEAQGRIVKSRPPQAFEPSLEWGLDRLRLYFQMIAPKESIGIFSEKAIRDQCAKRAKPLSKLETERRVRDATEKMYKRIWCRIIKPEQYLPTSEEFEAFCEVRKAA